jgi:hypothetical protein
MKKLFIPIVMLFLLVSHNLINASTTIKINGKSCNYSIELPANWDTIPADTLTKRFGRGVFDIGTYNLKNKSYFEGGFVQYLFLPTLKSLNQMTFEQITEELKNSIDFENKQSPHGPIKNVTDNFIADKERHVFRINGKLISGKKERNYTQIILLTKFGFLKIFSYEAVGAKSNNEQVNDLLSKVEVSESYKYIEHASKSGFNIFNLLIAFAIGLVVYYGILYIPKIMQLFTKK